MDIKARLEDVTFTMNEGQLVMIFVFQDEQSETIFQLKSEPSNLDVNQIQNKYKNVVMKIRSAKVLQRSNDKTPTILYKNFDSILYFNF